MRAANSPSPLAGQLGWAPGFEIGKKGAVCYARFMDGPDRKGGWKKGAWRVNRERCRLTHGTAPKPSRGTLPIGDVIPEVMRKLGLGDRHWLTVLAGEWAGLVGETVAKHTRPGRMAGRELVVFVDSSVWLSELTRYGRKKILGKLQQRFGKERIRDLRLQLDPEGAAGLGKRA